MTAWQSVLQLKDVFHDEDRTFIERRDLIVTRIKAQDWYDEDDMDLEWVVEELAAAPTEEEFDAYWNDFYDWADTHLVWVETF